MNNQFTITVGIGEDKDHKQLAPDFVRAVAVEFETRAAKEFGGYTIVKGYGGWVNGDGDLVCEQIVQLQIYTDFTTQVYAFARDLRNALNQASVVVARTLSEVEFV